MGIDYAVETRGNRVKIYLINNTALTEKFFCGLVTLDAQDLSASRFPRILKGLMPTDPRDRMLIREIASDRSLWLFDQMTDLIKARLLQLEPKRKTNAEAERESLIYELDLNLKRKDLESL